MTTALDISVVIPAYNSAAFLSDALTSILEQTVPAREIIVVDDGSTDRTKELIQQSFPSVRYIRQTNSGPAEARNNGMQAAIHPWIAFLDADDTWTPQKLEEQIALVDRFPELVLVASDMAQTDESMQVVESSAQGQHDLLEFFKETDGRPIENALAKLMETNFIPTGTVLARRDVLLDAGGFPVEIHYGEDLALWARVSARHPIACLPEVHMLRRRHGTNATRRTVPLFRDIVAVTEGVRDWGHDILAAQGVNADELVARAWADLGYSYFCEDEFDEALIAFKASLTVSFNRRSLVYLFACYLPGALLQRLRSVKQGFGQA